MRRQPLLIVLLLLSYGVSGQVIFRKNDKNHLKAFDEGLNWVYGQRMDARKLNYGLYLGLNYQAFKVAYNIYVRAEEIQSEASLSPAFGVAVDYNFSPRVSLRFLPSLTSARRTLSYPYLTEEEGRKVFTQSDYLSLALLAKINFDRFDNIRPYFTGGLSAGYDLSAKTLADVPRFPLSGGLYNFEFGGGVEVYFRYFRIALDLRGLVGLRNYFDQNAPASVQNSNIKGLFNRGLLIGLVIN